ncbi:hypothetical protein ACS3UN_12305 [Oscillospiraceae bacterium LTW-04]|nr:hypothetical protein RBH76_00105 [Oscillospiraceae bacterium MB24-C1]
MQILKVDSENSGVGVRQFKLLFQFGGASLRGFEFSGYRGVLRFCFFKLFLKGCLLFLFLGYRLFGFRLGGSFAFLSFSSNSATFFFSAAITFSDSALPLPCAFLSRSCNSAIFFCS